VYKLKIDQSFCTRYHAIRKTRHRQRYYQLIEEPWPANQLPRAWETEAQFAFLREQGCDEMQGYLFSKPILAKQFEALLRQDLAPDAMAKPPLPDVSYLNHI